MADNMAYVPKPDSGTKRPKMTTPRNGACDIVLSTKSSNLHMADGRHYYQNKILLPGTAQECMKIRLKFVGKFLHFFSKSVFFR